MALNGDSSKPNPLYRCAGPNCGQWKGASDRWWVMWASIEEHHAPVLYLAPWSEELAKTTGALHVCGELCAQKLQSQYMDNVLKNILAKAHEAPSSIQEGPKQRS
jgi:hypothetical protein